MFSEIEWEKMCVQPFRYDCFWTDGTSLARAHTSGSAHARKPRIYTSRHNCAWMSKKYYFIFLIVFKISEIVKCEFDGRSNRSWCEKSSFTFCQSLSKAWWRSTNYSRFIIFSSVDFWKYNFATFLLSVLSYGLWSATNQYREKILFSFWWVGGHPRFTPKRMLHFCYHKGKWQI